MTGRENGDMTTPMIGTESPTARLNPRCASRTRTSPGASVTRGGASDAMASALSGGVPALGGPSSLKMVLPPQASASSEAWKKA